MSEKYIDLAPQIASMHDQPLGTMRVALGLLDEFASDHPDQVPGRTITESEISKAFGTDYVAWARLCLARIGITVIPDPEPTNAEKLEIALKTHFGPGAFTVEGGSLSRFLDGIGVTAPEANDDQ